jgi:chemotaxis protein MotB
MARKKKHEEHENHERWLVSYADFITLLFAFFVVMYSVSAVNEGKFRVLSSSLVAAFRANPASMQPIPVGTPSTAFSVEPTSQQPDSATPPELMPSLTPPIQYAVGNPEQGDVTAEPSLTEAGQALGEIADRVSSAFEDLIKEDLITVKREKFFLEVEIRTNVLFTSGSAGLEPEAIRILQRVAEILRDYPNDIQVEGFTDDVPINTVAYPSNWELSAARSASVVHLFMDKGMNPRRMAAVGYGQYRPTAGNDTPEGRRQNRKVVIVVLGTSNGDRRLMEMQQSARTEPPPTPPAAEAPVSPGAPQ